LALLPVLTILTRPVFIRILLVARDHLAKACQEQSRRRRQLDSPLLKEDEGVEVGNGRKTRLSLLTQQRPPKTLVILLLKIHLLLKTNEMTRVEE
jgi:hypothetical protein